MSRKMMALWIAGLALAVGVGIVVWSATAAPADEPAKVVTVVNDKCPMTGKAFDAAKLTDDRIRTFKDMKVGFCCGHCPAAWDKLTDAEKDAKLKAVMKEEPKK